MWFRRPEEGKATSNEGKKTGAPYETSRKSWANTLYYQKAIQWTQATVGQNKWAPYFPRQKGTIAKQNYDWQKTGTKIRNQCGWRHGSGRVERRHAHFKGLFQQASKSLMQHGSHRVSLLQQPIQLCRGPSLGEQRWWCMGWGQTQRELNLLETYLSVKTNDQTAALLHASLLWLAFQAIDEGNKREERTGWE